MHRIKNHLWIVLPVAVIAFAGVVLDADEPVSDRATIERDLELLATLKTPKTIEAGEPIALGWTLRNASKTIDHKIVEPGDGSGVGWREPHVYHVVERHAGTDGWQAVPAGPIGRCGNFDSNWHDEVRTLKPGESVKIDAWVTPPNYTHEFQKAGRYRVIACYDYKAGAAGKRLNAAQGPGPMKNTPAFSLRSEPVELAVTRPIDIVVTPRGPLVADTPTKLSALLRIELLNRSDAARSLPLPTKGGPGHCYVQMQHHSVELTLNVPPDTRDDRAIAKLAPDESAALIAPDALDGTVNFRSNATALPATIRVRATYMHTNKAGHTVQTVSEWVDVKVVRKHVAIAPL